MSSRGLPCHKSASELKDGSTQTVNLKKREKCKLNRTLEPCVKSHGIVYLDYN